MADIDETILKNKLMPKSWKCPHCGSRETVDKYADECLLMSGKVMRHCGRCGYVHLWKLELTDSFKKGVIKFLMEKETLNGGADR